MFKNTVALYLVVVLLASAFSITARAGVTISDKRYWPSEARGSQGQVIEIHPPSYAYPGPAVGFATQPRVAPRGKARRPR